MRIASKKRETPSVYEIYYTLEYKCFKGKHDLTWLLGNDCFGQIDVIKQAICQATATVPENMMVIMPQKLAFPSIHPYEEQSAAVADFWWLCGGKHLRATLPKG